MSDIKLDLFTWCPGVESNHGHRDFQSLWQVFSKIRLRSHAIEIS